MSGLFKTTEQSIISTSQNDLRLKVTFIKKTKHHTVFKAKCLLYIRLRGTNKESFFYVKLKSNDLLFLFEKYFCSFYVVF